MTDKTQAERAFPWYGDLNETRTINLGMTMRDYFAAKAMQGICSTNPKATYEEVSSFAYQMADAMIRARGQ